MQSETAHLLPGKTSSKSPPNQSYSPRPDEIKQDGCCEFFFSYFRSRQHSCMSLLSEWKRVLITILWSSFVVAMLVNLPDIYGYKDEKPWMWIPWTDGSTASMMRIGSVLGFILAFRCNSGYARWMEARTVWGTVVGKCLRCGQLAALHIEDPARKDRIFKWLIAFPVLLKRGLLGTNSDLEKDRTQLCVEDNVLELQELEDVASQKGWPGAYAVEVIRACVVADLRAQAAERGDSSNSIALAAHLQIEEMLNVLTASVGQALKIKSTAGQPMALPGFLNLLIDTFLFVCPITWAHDAGWLLPPLMGFIAALFSGLIDITDRLEKPFYSVHGVGWVALDMGKFCQIIKAQVNAIRERYQPGKEGALGLDLPASARTQGGQV